LSRLAIACDIELLQPGIAERVLDGDETVCGRKNSRAFEQTRKHLMALFEVENRAIRRVGVDDVREILDSVRTAFARLRKPAAGEFSGDDTE
jgi:hypothetical protein